MNDKHATIDIRVVPRASKSEIVGWHDAALKVRIAAPPVDGAANVELTRLISKAFGVPRSSIEIVSGETSKNKRLRINGLSQADAEAILKNVLAA